MALRTAYFSGAQFTCRKVAVEPGEVLVVSDKDASWPDWDGKALQ